MLKFLSFYVVTLFVSPLILTVQADDVPELAQMIKGNADRLRMEGHVLYFDFDELPTPPELRIPRLRCRMKSIGWNSNSDQQLNLVPEQNAWVVSLKEPPESKPITVRLELLDPPVLGTKKVITDLSPDKSQIELPAHIADVYGEKLRFEPQPHKNTIGYWTVPSDWAEWHLNAPSAGVYSVEIFQGCGKGQGGSLVDIEFLEHENVIDRISFVVEDTGHFQNFKLRQIGKVHLPDEGDYRLQIRPRKLANKAVMDVRKIVLTPVPPQP